MLRLTTSVKEQQIIRGCQKAKPEAQQALYKRYASLMLGVCRRYIHDPMEAEHVMVGGMVKVFKSIQSYSGSGSFEGWIRRIMVNESLMYLRKNKSMSLSADIDTVPEQPGYEDLSDKLQADDLIAMIDKLPDGYRTVFNLYAIEGYKHEEIAERLQISVGTSKSQLNRARKMLQKQLISLEKETRNTASHGK